MNCHAGLSAFQVHPTFKLRCIDCHGGNDQVVVPEDAFEDDEIFRDEDLILEAHIRPKNPALARFFYSNGIDDDGDGAVDEGPDLGANLIADINDVIVEQGEIVEFGQVAGANLQDQGVGQFIDAEYNRDLNYTRWINPGDLRVATATCGAAAPSGISEGTACHQTVVETMRRSIMVNQSAVINGAYYGQESSFDKFQDARDDPAVAFDPRAGAFGYTLDYTLADGCIVAPSPEEIDADPRAQVTFDSQCLEDAVADSNNDANALADAPGNVGLPTFEISQGKVAKLDLTLLQDNLKAINVDLLVDPNFDFVFPEGGTIRHQAARQSRFEWGGNPIRNPDASLLDLDPVPFDDNFAGLGITDPVDLVLRGFRAYYPLNYPGSAVNFTFTFGTSIQPEVGIINTANPFGRGRSTGCTSCHMRYNFDGSRDAQLVKVFDEEGNFVGDELFEDPTTKHREFDPITQDVVNVNGKDELVGIAVALNERDVDDNNVIEDGFDANDGAGNSGDNGGIDREQQRYYSAQHQLTARIDTDMCGSCHVFVTRIDLAYQGMAEDEQRDLLARREKIQFTTPAGTNVVIHDSLVREENNQLINVDDALQVIQQAIQRDALLADDGLVAGAGGCAQRVFTEDCNNNGELDNEVVLQRFDEQGNLIAEATINEDANGNGELDLIDHVPREFSQDGRQMRYVYGGANGSTRQMDVHFEVGMHCIDCHMLQDTHGDGNIYSTNWDQIEIECDDCHGGLQKATLTTTGPNGLNDLTKAIDHDGRPFFERKDGKIIQRSRVTPGVFWVIPETVESSDPNNAAFNAEAAESHNADHLPDQPGAFEFEIGSIFADEEAIGESELVDGKLECYTCHMSWVHNCMGCHYNANGKANNRIALRADNTVDAVPGENEVWFNNFNQDQTTNFQLLEFMRAPFVMGTNAAADAGRIGTFRSSMQLHVSNNDAAGDTQFDSITFTTHLEVDGNSGRENVAASGAVLNQTMPHTVRPIETRSCESCHKLVDIDNEDRVLNDHILAEAFGIGAGRYPYLGDWAFAVGDGGLELFEYKEEAQFIVGNSNRWPGIILNGNGGDRVLANVEPLFAAGDLVRDVALIRNFNKLPAAPGQTEVPSLQDLAVVVGQIGGQQRILISEVTLRGNPAAARPNVVDNGGATDLLTLPGEARALAHLAPDVSDPFIYVASGSAGLVTVQILDEPIGGQNVLNQLDVDGINNGNATEITLAGDIAYVGTDAGTIEVFDLSDPTDPDFVRTVNLGDANAQVNALSMAGFFLYAGTSGGLAVLDVTDQESPKVPDGADDFIQLAGQNLTGAFVYGNRVFAAAGAQGIREIDTTIPAAVVDLGDLAQRIAGQAVNVRDVVVSKVPTQTWVLGLENNGNLVGVKFDDNVISIREKCFQDGQSPVDLGCGLDMDFRDMTIMGRDPSVLNPAAVRDNGAAPDFDDNDPSGPPFFRLASALIGGVNNAQRLGLPAYWEKINTHSGRRYRDSFMPGTGTLSRQVMVRMYEVPICEDPNSDDVNGNGLRGLGRADLEPGECRALKDLTADEYFQLIEQRRGQRLAKAESCTPDPNGDLFGTDEERLATCK